MIKIVTHVVTTLAIAAGIAIIAPVTQAEEGSGKPEFAPMMMVLDASGSMTADDSGGGQNRMDAAKTATRTFIDDLPAQAQVGLTTYGTGTGSTDAEKAAGCQDITVLNKVGTTDKTALRNSVDGIVPRGYTPIGASLRKAAEQLPDSGPRSIVLVSDGIDTCSPPPPCEVAAELAADGVDLRIHTIGFQVDPKAREELTCIAQATGGSYYDAHDGNTLEGVLPRVVDRALRDYQPRGIPVRGTAERDGAPVLKAGQYLDTMAAPETRYYAVDVPKGARVRFTGTVILPSATAQGFKYTDVTAYGPGGKDCLSGDHALGGDGFEGFPVSGTATVPRDGKSGACTETEGRYTFSITRKEDETGGDEVRPVEISVYIEPPLTEGSQTGPPAVESDDNDGKVEFVEPTGTEQAVTGGGSFADAPLLPGSGKYTDALRDGETVFYRVRLGWGQALAYTVVGGPVPKQSDTTSAMSAATVLYTPVRQNYESEVSVMGSQTAADLRPVETPPVRYNNRDRHRSPYVGPIDLAGDYYIAINTRRRADSTNPPVPGEVPFRLNVSVIGEEIPAPAYTALPTNESDPVENTEASENVGDTTSSALLWVAIAAGVVVIACAGGMGVFLARRRR